MIFDFLAITATLVGLCVGSGTIDVDNQPHSSELVTNDQSFFVFQFGSSLKPSAYVWVPMAVDDDSCQENLALLEQLDSFPVETDYRFNSRPEYGDITQLFGLRYSNAEFYGLCTTGRDFDLQNHAELIDRNSTLKFYSKNYTFTPNYGCNSFDVNKDAKLPILGGLSLYEYQSQKHTDDLYYKIVVNPEFPESYPLFSNVSVGCEDSHLRSSDYYRESGSLTATCNASGLWEITEANAICKKGCTLAFAYRDFANIERSSECMINGITHLYHQNESCQYKCSKGFHAVQPNSQAVCNSEGEQHLLTFCEADPSHWYVYLIVALGVVGLGFLGFATFLFIQWRNKNAYVPLE